MKMTKACSKVLCLYRKIQETILFSTSILPDCVSHERSKDFENMRTDFIGRCQNSPWQTTPKMMCLVKK